LGQVLKDVLDSKEAKKQSCASCDKLSDVVCTAVKHTRIEIRKPEEMGGGCNLYVKKKDRWEQVKRLPVQDLVPHQDYTAIVSKVGTGFKYLDGTPITDPAKIGYLRKHYPQPPIGMFNEPEVPTTKKEETTMSNAIIRLADSQFTKEVADFGGLNIDLREALQDMQATQKKEAAIAAAKEVMGVLNAAETVIEDNVGNIRSARSIVENSKARIASINRAKAYGLETNNFVPLGILIGSIYEHHVENKELTKVPSDWAPKVSAAATKSE
jgi:hypothetical protein